MVAIDGWEAHSLYPSGHYVRTLGQIGDKETETDVGWVPGGGRLRGLQRQQGCAWGGASREALNCSEPGAVPPAVLAALHCLQHRPTSNHSSLPSAPQVLLIENDINTNPFTPAVHACVPPLPWTVTEADVADPQRCAAASGVCCCCSLGALAYATLLSACKLPALNNTLPRSPPPAPQCRPAPPGGLQRGPARLQGH